MPPSQEPPSSSSQSVLVLVLLALVSACGAVCEPTRSDDAGRSSSRTRSSAASTRTTSAPTPTSSSSRPLSLLFQISALPRCALSPSTMAHTSPPSPSPSSLTASRPSTPWLATLDLSATRSQSFSGHGVPWTGTRTIISRHCTESMAPWCASVRVLNVIRLYSTTLTHPCTRECLL